MEEPKLEITSKEREQEYVRVNASLILKICQEEKFQPRERLLKEFEKSGRADNQALALRELVLKMPDYDLEEKDDFEKAREYIELIFRTKESLVGQEVVGRESEMMKNWVSVGVFAYELTGDGEADDRMVIHVPPTDKSPKLGQIRDSLVQIANFLKQNPDIIEVNGSSLLLAHSLAKKLGFTAQTDGKNEFGLTFKMSREEFIKRWG